MSDERYYDTIADELECWMDDFDLRTRLEWFDDRLAEIGLDGRTVLDVGSGAGHFSRLVARRGGSPVSLDIAPRLLRRAEPERAVNGSALELPFPEASLEVVVSSECIEHTPDPRRALREMTRVLRPGGHLLMSCPNRAWRWSVPVARALGLRRFSGIENWLPRRAVRRTFEKSGMQVLRDDGLYLLPFQIRPLRPLIDWTNRHAQWLRPLMINQCWAARKLG